jgi:four helix bundle protein
LNSRSPISGLNPCGIPPAPLEGMSFSGVDEIRAWQCAYAFKLAVYELIRTTAIDRDFLLRDQLRRSAASAVSQLEEGFARFYPKDFGRLAVGAKASIAESRGHLRDAVDSGHISPDVRMTHDTMAAETLKELVGLIDYLQSPEAEENARRIKAKRAETRRQRQAQRKNREPEP